MGCIKYPDCKGTRPIPPAFSTSIYSGEFVQAMLQGLTNGDVYLVLDATFREAQQRRIIAYGSPIPERILGQGEDPEYPVPEPRRSVPPPFVPPDDSRPGERIRGGSAPPPFSSMPPGVDLTTPTAVRDALPGEDIYDVADDSDSDIPF
jgi:hypothetical protein